jgi:hypothetical protein
MAARLRSFEEVRVIRLLAPACVVVATLAPRLALAQVNIDQDKTPAAMYSSDCSVCHKSIRGLANGRDRSSLTDYLAEHYTASHSEAAALAAYVLAGGGGTGAPTPVRGEKPQPDHTQPGAEEPRTREARKPGKPEEEPTAEAKPPAGAAERTKPARPERSASAEPSIAAPEVKPPEAKPPEGKPAPAARLPHGRQKPTAVAAVPKPAEPSIPAPPTPSPQVSPTPAGSAEATPQAASSPEASPAPAEASPTPTDDIPD